VSKNFTTLMERPEINNSIAALVYQVVAYFSIPFLLLLLLQGGQSGIREVASGIELAYHVFNFFVALFIYREYLTDTFSDIRFHYKKLLKASMESIELILLIALALYFTFGIAGGGASLLGFGALPLVEVDLFILPCDILPVYPLIGSLCLVFLAPVAISCLFYGSVFAPICYTRPVLAYIAMAAFLAFPRFCNASTYWDPATEWTLYFLQLPIHLLACRSYQKADSIWAPILTLSLVNGIACILLFVGHALGFV
jgi:hypothetical protein